MFGCHSVWVQVGFTSVLKKSLEKGCAFQKMAVELA